MKGFLARFLVTAAGLTLAAVLVPGVRIDGLGTLLVAALLIGLINAIVRPLVVILTLPLTLLTLGLFLLVINAAMFALAAALLPGFTVSGFFAALAGWLILSLVSWLASSYIGPQGRYEVLIVERRRW